VGTDPFFHFHAVILILFHESEIIFAVFLLERHFGYLGYVPVDLLDKLGQSDHMRNLPSWFLSLLHAFFELQLHLVLEDGRGNNLLY
jgi:hypothetical protein